MNRDYSTFGGMYGVSTPVQGTFCTQPNGQQGVINDRGQCVSQAPAVSPNTMGMFNINNIPNPQLDLNSGYYGQGAVDYITNVTGVDNSEGVKSGYSGQEQSAMMDKAQQEIERAYQLYLGRDSDSGGLDYYSQQLFNAALFAEKSGDTSGIRSILDEIKNSPEGQAYAASQSSAATESTGSELDVTSFCDGTTFVIDFGNGTIDRLENNINCGGTGSTVDDTTTDDTTVDDTTVDNLAEGSYLGKQCSGTTMIMLYADGEGGSTQQQTPNSTECGYVDPPAEPEYSEADQITNSYTSPDYSQVGTVTGMNYSPFQAGVAAPAGQSVDNVKMLRGWLTNSLFKDII